MEKILDMIGDFIADGILELFIADERRYIIALISFSICILVNVVLAFLNRTSNKNVQRKIFFGVLLMNITISFTSVMLCKLSLAIIISIISTIVLPIFERSEIKTYLKIEYKVSIKKYIIYVISSIISIFVGSIVL